MFSFPGNWGKVNVNVVQDILELNNDMENLLVGREVFFFFFSFSVVFESGRKGLRSVLLVYSLLLVVRNFVLQMMFGD